MVPNVSENLRLTAVVPVALVNTSLDCIKSRSRKTIATKMTKICIESQGVLQTK